MNNPGSQREVSGSFISNHEKSVTGCNVTPTMHPDYAIGTPVACRLSMESEEEFTGTIDGVASCHVIFFYIIRLDKPLPFEGYKSWKAVSVSGTLLRPLTNPV